MGSRVELFEQTARIATARASRPGRWRRAIRVDRLVDEPRRVFVPQVDQAGMEADVDW